MMKGQELQELINARRSCRAYQGKQVPRELLTQVLEAGRMAPSGMNVQQCHFIVLQKPALLEEIRLLIQELFAAMEPEGLTPLLAHAAAAAKEGNHSFFYGAPTLIVVANRRDNGNHLPDSATAMQNMMLMATALGLGNCWINNLRWSGDAPQVREFLVKIGVQEDEAVYASLALGYAAEVSHAVLPRSGNTVEILN